MSSGQMPPPPPSSPYQPPATPPGPPGGDAERLPWEERSRLGIANALVDTVKLLITAPADAYRRLRADGDLMSPILFGVILSWVSVIVSQLWSAAFGNVLQRMLEQMGELGETRAPGIGGLIGLVVVWPIVYAVILFIASGINHLCLMIVNALERSATGFEGTLKVIAYSSVSGLANVIPFIGGIVSMLATIVLLVIGFTEVHRTTQGKALLAVLIPVGVCCACGLIAAVLFGAALAAILAGIASQ